MRYLIVCFLISGLIQVNPGLRQTDILGGSSEEGKMTTTPLIAVAVQENGRVAPHAGRADVWQVYAFEMGAPELVWTLRLTSEGSLHEWHVRNDGNRHPLHTVDVAICRSAGDGVMARLAERNTLVVTTLEPDPFIAVQKYLEGTLGQQNDHDDSCCSHRH